MHVIATAGHVDHGKSTLVRELTGMDPDRLHEEKRRGLTIELGFAWTRLADVGDVAFVDVPGHERFVPTMLAGVGPVPVAVLVVAADDPWMPQAQEHLAVLDALGVRHGVVVVSRSDCADPSPMMARAAAEVERTSLAGAPVVAVSARTGAGLDHLRSTVADVLRTVPSSDPAADVRLWADRSFEVRGAGRVVTGTLSAGTVRVGDELLVGTRRARVRGLQTLGRTVDVVVGPARVAVNLGGSPMVTRGTPLLTPGAFASSQLVDVAVPDSRSLPSAATLHVGTARVGASIRPLGPGFARLRLELPVPLRVGDRVLLRDPGSRAVWGATVLDPAPPSLSRRGAASARASDLASLDGSASAHLSLRGAARVDDLRRMGLDLPAGAVRVGPWVVNPAQLDTWHGQLVELVAAARTKGRPGATTAAVVAHLELPDPHLLAPLMRDGLVTRDGYVMPSVPESSTLPDSVISVLDDLRQELTDRPFAAPGAGDLASRGLDDRTARMLHGRGLLLRLAPGVVLLPGADDEAVRRLGALDQPFTTSAARQHLETSRRVALALLAHLDATGRTLRLADDTRRLRNPSMAGEPVRPGS